MTLVLNDDDLRRLLRPEDVVRWVGEAVDAHHAGRLSAPARVHADLGGDRLVFTAGRLAGEWFGYRSYGTTGAEPGAQVVVVHDESTGEVRAIAVGNELGPRRTGAIGAVAADALAPPGEVTVGLVGAGVQAGTQLWALQAVRDLTEVRVFARDPSRGRRSRPSSRRRSASTCVRSSRPGRRSSRPTSWCSRPAAPSRSCAPSGSGRVRW